MYINEISVEDHLRHFKIELKQKKRKQKQKQKQTNKQSNKQKQLQVFQKKYTEKKIQFLTIKIAFFSKKGEPKTTEGPF